MKAQGGQITISEPIEAQVAVRLVGGTGEAIFTTEWRKLSPGDVVTFEYPADGIQIAVG